MMRTMILLLFTMLYFRGTAAYNPETSWWNTYAFATLTDDGTVTALGWSGYGGTAPNIGLTGVKTIFGRTIYNSISTSPRSYSI